VELAFLASSFPEESGQVTIKPSMSALRKQSPMEQIGRLDSKDFLRISLDAEDVNFPCQGSTLRPTTLTSLQWSAYDLRLGSQGKLRGRRQPCS
jgi:hypothetical protein